MGRSEKGNCKSELKMRVTVDSYKNDKISLG